MTSEALDLISPTEARQELGGVKEPLAKSTFWRLIHLKGIPRHNYGSSRSVRFSRKDIVALREDCLISGPESERRAVDGRRRAK